MANQNEKLLNFTDPKQTIWGKNHLIRLLGTSLLGLVEQFAPQRNLTFTFLNFSIDKGTIYVTRFFSTPYCSNSEHWTQKRILSRNIHSIGTCLNYIKI